MTTEGNTSGTRGNEDQSVNPGKDQTVNPSKPIALYNQVEKPEKFTGKNFKRWQEKMKFYLTTLRLDRFLTKDPPTFDGEPN